MTFLKCAIFLAGRGSVIRTSGGLPKVEFFWKSEEKIFLYKVESINQSINQLINQSINQSINQ